MRSDHRVQLAAVVARFLDEVQRLVRSSRPEERDRALAALDPARARAARRRGQEAGAAASPRRASKRAAATRARPAAKRRSRKPDPAGRQIELALGEPEAAVAAATEGAAPAVAEASMAPVPAASPPADATATATAEPGAKGRGRVESSGKRVRWTRESIIHELARWMVSGTAIDSSFVKRHGPPGLVPAALRVFGRFDAALNVAGLEVSKLYPDGPPAR